VFEFCSGLVDLVVCVGHYLGGAHRFALAGERFVGLVAEHIAQMGDHGAEFREYRRGEGTESEPGDGWPPEEIPLASDFWLEDIAFAACASAVVLSIGAKGDRRYCLHCLCWFMLVY
jgi:hypothetical protein